MDPEASHEQRVLKRMQLIYTRKTHERQIFMDELKLVRKRRTKCYLRAIRTLIGPTWYQALSVIQRQALDTLESSIYQDLLEDRATRTRHIVIRLGIYPRPNQFDLLKCCVEGQQDPKKMLGHLFVMMYGHPISMKRMSYDFNARMLLSSIYYLGLKEIKTSLQKIFEPDKQEEKPRKKPKSKSEKPLASPYLQKMVAALYAPEAKKRPPPLPLPNLDALNEAPLHVEEVLQKPPPPPPPPPPPKDRLPRSYCDKIADVYTVLKPQQSITKMKRMTQSRKRRVSKQTTTEVKKTYGIGMTRSQSAGTRIRKPPCPSTGLWNMQYNICGVYMANGRRYFVIGNVTVLPPTGEMIHGGYALVGDKYMNIHCGFQGAPPPPLPDPCDCVKRWHSVVFEYVKRTKCYCGHHYDYYNEGTFPPEELPFFHKPTKHSPAMFNYDNIYNTDPKSLYIDKEFKRIWETDSMLRVDDGTAVKPKKKKKVDASKTCLGEHPTPENYLKCALNIMKEHNIAARLPELHLAPELKEWMRYRIYGPYTREQKSELLRQSTTFWYVLHTLESKGLGHVSPPFNPAFAGDSNWSKKQYLNDSFKKYVSQYKLKLFRSFAKVTNLMWPTMFQAEFPDKKFREIFYSYLYPTMEDMHLMHPYSVMETADRFTIINKKRMICIPAGAENIEK